MESSQADMMEKWEGGKDFEINFWSSWVRDEGGEWPKEFKERFDPELPLQSYITVLLDSQATEVRILDVGAGPLTIVGKVWPGHDVELIAVDALGDQYTGMLAKKGLKAPVPTEVCNTEELTQRFSLDQFDLVHVRNALDHGFDPMHGIAQMLSVVKKGGVVTMYHFANEAKNAKYKGFHQWNFTVEDRDLVIWNRDSRQVVGPRFREAAEIVEISPDGDDWTTVVMRKKVSGAVS